jgi:hypothetical protein
MTVAILDDYQNVALRLPTGRAREFILSRRTAPHEIGNAFADFTFSVRNGAFAGD